MAITVENLCGYIIRSRLHGPEEVRRLYQQWTARASDRRSVPEFVRWLVAHGHLTEYQALLLSHGHTQNFFLGEYRILDRIGKGRFAGVYKAVHRLGQVVAVKVLPPSKAKDPGMLARFQREARLAMRLTHPSVVRTFQFGESNGLHYIVMEYLEGETLEAFLRRRGPLPPMEAVRIAFLTALGLDHLHEQGMVHRDIKPGNLMLTPKPKGDANTLRSMVKILDIGLGRELFRAKGRPFAADLTTEGLILGTPDYLAPEQARDSKQADIRSDLYGLGCTLYHSLCGRPPFQDDNPVRQILRHATEPPRPLDQYHLSIPEGLNRIVMKLLAKDPGQRYQTPKEIAEALKAFLAGVPEPVRTESPEMRSYLRWLKERTSTSGEIGEGGASSDRAVSASSKVRAKPPPSVARVLREERLKSHLQGPPALAATAAADDPPVQFDVEVVPTVGGRLLGMPRDVAMFLFGAAAGGILAAAAWCLYAWRGS